MKLLRFFRGKPPNFAEVAKRQHRERLAMVARGRAKREQYPTLDAWRAEHKIYLRWLKELKRTADGQEPEQRQDEGGSSYL